MFNAIKTFRIDYLSDVKIEEPAERFDELRNVLDGMEPNVWGVGFGGGLNRKKLLEHVGFTVKIEKGEDYIVRRLQREKRVGEIEKIDDFTYRFTADVYETSELIPWIRTFICRITELHLSNRTVENKFKQDLNEMYKIYGVKSGVKY